MKVKRVWSLFLALALCNLTARAQDANRPGLRPELLNTNHTNWQTVRPGLEHLQLARGSYKEGDPSAGPWFINILRVNPRSFKLEVRHAMDSGVGLETVSDMAQRLGAVAAVNAGFFAMNGSYRGDSVGALMVDKSLLSEPWPGRTAVALVQKERATELIFSPLRWDNQLRITNPAPDTPRPLTAAVRVKLNGINRPRNIHELILYTSDFHRTTLTDNNGVEAVVCGDKVEKLREYTGSTVIPLGCYVLSANGAMAEWAALMLRPKAVVELKSNCLAQEGGNDEDWKQVSGIVTGGPRLLRAGLTEINLEQEKMSREFSETWHPRTAIGRMSDGRILLVTVDGRQPQLSAGMSLEMLARLLQDFDAKEALNLDGGGSTTMFINGKVVNSPSDKAGERPVSDALLLFPRLAR